MQRIEITKDTSLSVGDIIEIHFKSMGMVWIKAAQMAAIEMAVKRLKQFDLINVDYLGNEIIYKLSVVKNPVTAALVITTIVIISAGLLIFLSLDKIYKIVELPGGGSISSGLWAVVAGLGVFTILWIYKK